MKWYRNILDGIISEYFIDEPNSLKRVNLNINNMWSALEQIFNPDDIPLETLIGVIQSSKNFLGTDSKLSYGSVSRMILGYAIIFAKSACEESIWTSDFIEYHPIQNIKKLNEYERDSLIQLQYKTTITPLVVGKFSVIFNSYSSNTDKRELIETLDLFKDPLYLADTYNTILNEVQNIAPDEPMLTL